MSAGAMSQIGRRGFLKTGAAGAAGLVIGFYLPGRAEASRAPADMNAGAKLNAWMLISPNDAVTIMIDKSEMGQGILTALCMIAAEELDCDWKTIRTEFAPAATEYFNPAFGMQGTGGSSSVRSSWDPMRKAGAAARDMLLQAAAAQWNVDKSACRTENGTIYHDPSKRKLSYGAVAAAASKLLVPQDVPLKDPSTYRIIGKPTKRLDTPDKVNGRAQFGIDARQPGMLYAVVARCPVFGGKVASFDAAKAKAVPGVKSVVQISSGVAVVADNTWSAMQGRRALEIKWDEGANAGANSENISKLFAEQMAKTGAEARKEGDAAAALSAAAQKVEAIYEAPYLAHATMEPINCTADVRADRVDVWAPTQFQTMAQGAAAKICGLKPENAFIHTTYLGGGFGRKAGTDFIIEAVETSKAVGQPVKLTWSREDDTQHDFYRPASYAKLSAGIGADGWPVALTSRIACPSIMEAWFPGSTKNNLDPSSVEGLATLPYSIPNIYVDYVRTEPGIPVGFWRSVGASQNGFFSECFIDELAAAGKKDPYEFRRRLLDKAPRQLGVLQLAAQKAGWDKPLPAGRYRGIAVLEAFQSFGAQVVEISLDRKARTVKVHRVVCAVDVGRVVNPANIVMQSESAVVYGLSSALYGEITIANGRVVQANFNNYPVLRMDAMPTIEVYIVPSEEKPTGAGELSVPPLVPALCNAIYTATGRRIRRLPIRPEDLA
ncbi:MAG TPA: xanthine dehydrogenase family protein molybdopterin-binding subunit [Candidatus Acidoferrales bacterium]|nr:xanthine dehydrogenase family protein molybdopterin-binding subunit [Candidatus Acidoferrales bacterium]